MANPIGMAEAHLKAQAFMNQKGKTIKATALKTPRKNSSATTAALYVFNAESTGGFVVVAGDDRVESILGYADEGSYDEANVPENMKAWLQGYADYIEHLDQIANTQPATTRPQPSPAPSLNGYPAAAGQSLAPRKVELHAAIAPLLSSKWDQGDTDNPTYNQFCPQDNGKYCYTGCVATAMAQIMYYHQWPQNQTASVGSLSPIQFDWDGMKPVYRRSDSQSDYEAVAQLMRYCGEAVDMSYGTSGSGAFSSNVAPALINDFDYSPGTRHVMRTFQSIASWDALIYKELSEKRPVYYSGVSTGGGHAFVCDGYDGNGFYHINWGWGGMSNGYFKLSVLNPDDSGIGGSTTSDGYSMDQEVVVGIAPSTESIETVPTVLSLDSWEVNGNEMSAIVYNVTGSDLTFCLGYAIAKEDGTPEILFSYEGEYDIQNFSGLLLPCDVDDLNLPDGTYFIGPVCRTIDDAEWHFCEAGKPYLQVTITDGQAVINYSTPQLQTLELKHAGNGIVNAAQEIQLTVENEASEFNGKLYLFASKTSQKGESQGMTGIALEEGDTQTVSLYFTPTTTGQYNLWVSTDEFAQNVIATGTVSIQSAPTGETTLEAFNCQITPAETTTISVRVENTSETTYYRNVIALLYNENNLEAYETYQASGNLTIKPHEGEDINFTFEGLTPGVNYTALICYYETYQSKYVSVMMQTEWFTIEEPVVNDLAEEKARLQQLVDDFKADLADLQPRIESLKAQCQNLLDQQSAADQCVKDLQQRLQQLEEKINVADIPDETRQQLQSEWEAIHTELGNAESKLLDLQLQLNQVETDLNDINKKYDGACQNAEYMTQSLADAETLEDLDAVEYLYNAMQQTYSMILNSLNTKEQQLNDAAADLTELVPTIDSMSERIDNLEAAINLEIVRQEVVNVLDELPPLAPHMTYDADEFEQIRSIVADWKAQKEVLEGRINMLQARLNDENDAKALTQEERETLTQELEDLQEELAGHNNTWESYLAAVNEYVGFCENYEAMYQDLLSWVDAQKQALSEATSLDDIEVIRQLVEDKREEVSNIALPNLASPSVEQMESEETIARLVAISYRLLEIEAMIDRIPTAINAMDLSLERPVDVWTTNGQLVCKSTFSLRHLPAGIYIICPAGDSSLEKKGRRVYVAPER